MKKSSVQMLAKIIVSILGIILVGWLLYRSPSVREIVVSGAGRMGAPAVGYLRKVATTDDDIKVRQQAMVALQDMNADAVPPLLEALGDEDAEVRKEAAFVLCTLGGAQAKQAVPNLIDSLKNDSAPMVRRFAARALGRARPSAQEAVAALLVSLKESEAIVRANSAEALSVICYLAEADADGIIPALIEALEDSGGSVRQEAAEGLGRIGPRANAALPALAKALQDPEFEVRTEAKEAIERIQRNFSPPQKMKAN
jgi:HEAT repeat protein